MVKTLKCKITFKCVYRALVPLLTLSKVLPRYRRPLAFKKIIRIHSIEFTIQIHTAIITCKRVEMFNFNFKYNSFRFNRRSNSILGHSKTKPTSASRTTVFTSSWGPPITCYEAALPSDTTGCIYAFRRFRKQPNRTV